MQKRISNYEDAELKTRIVIDYCAQFAVIPRKYDGEQVPAPWRGVSSQEVQKGVAKHYNEEISERLAGWTWERLGANHDVAGALSILQERREAFLDAGRKELANWDA